MEQSFLHDIAYYQEWFNENQECWIKPYIEQHFTEASWMYQHAQFKKYLYFCKKIIEDYKLSLGEKYNRFLREFKMGKSKIATIFGGRGAGKTALGMKILEDLHDEKIHSHFFYIKKGERPVWLPQWINHVTAMEDVPNKSFAMLDETAIEYSARNFYKDENKSFTERLVILRHKDISVILLTQHSKMIDINIRRLSDIIIYKRGANIEHEDKEDTERTLIIHRLMPRNSKGMLIEIKIRGIFWYAETDLPRFWDDDLVSKTFKNYNPELQRRIKRKEQLDERIQENIAKLNSPRKPRSIIKKDIGVRKEGEITYIAI